MYSAPVFLCSFQEAVGQPDAEVGLEAKALGRLEASLVGPGFVFTARAEEQFYLSNNLPEQLRAVFRGINPRRLDEDALDDACARAARLVTTSYLLEDFISQAYLALANAGVAAADAPDAPLHVRREGSGPLEAERGRRGALLALKRLWAADWAFDAVLSRLDATGSVGQDARPALVFAGGRGDPDAALSARASHALGRGVAARSSGGRVVGLEAGRPGAGAP